MEIDRIPVAPHVQGLIQPYLEKMAEAQKVFVECDLIITTVLAAAHIQVMQGWTYDDGWLMAPKQEEQDGEGRTSEQEEGPTRKPSIAIIPEGWSREGN